ncbi:MAG: hypothetical protein ACPGSE_00280 [Synechococcus sp.]
MTFTAPQHVTTAYTAQIRRRLLETAFRQAEEAQQHVGSEERFIKHGVLVNLKRESAYDGKVYAADINFRVLKGLLDDQVTQAVELLEDRVNRNLAETDELFDVNLTVEADLIEGVLLGKTANGEQFQIDVKMITNYRYGENSANGVLTVYPQFRGTRQGAPLEGKVQQSKATAKKAAEKAEREAAKAARRAELRTKFGKAPERLARQCEKDIDFWGSHHPTAPQWAFIAGAARALTEEQLDEMFAKGDRTSGDIQGRLEKQFRLQGVA